MRIKLELNNDALSRNSRVCEWLDDCEQKVNEAIDIDRLMLDFTIFGSVSAGDLESGKYFFGGDRDE